MLNLSLAVGPRAKIVLQMALANLPVALAWYLCTDLDKSFFVPADRELIRTIGLTAYMPVLLSCDGLGMTMALVGGKRFSQSALGYLLMAPAIAHASWLIFFTGIAGGAGYSGG